MDGILRRFFFKVFLMLDPEVFEDTSKKIFFDSLMKMLAHVYLTYLKSPHTHFLPDHFWDSVYIHHHVWVTSDGRLVWLRLVLYSFPQDVLIETWGSLRFSLPIMKWFLDTPPLAPFQAAASLDWLKPPYLQHHFPPLLGFPCFCQNLQLLHYKASLDNLISWKVLPSVRLVSNEALLETNFTSCRWYHN